LLKKTVLSILGVVVILGIIGYVYVYQDHRDISTTATFQSFDSKELLTVFTDNSDINDKKILDQVIEVTGVVTDTLDNTLVLDDHIFVALEKNNIVVLSQKIIIKGRCLGYDDLLEEVKLDQASIIKSF